jgi:hypothetical protein
VRTEDLIGHDSGDREALETVYEALPHLHGVPPLALVVKPIYAIERRALMVATQQEDVLGVPELIAQ